MLENLTRLNEGMNKKTSILVCKLSRLAYRKLQNAIITKAIEFNVPIALVNPANTSRLCPKCWSELNYYDRLGVCPNCHFIADRDKVASLNLYKRMWASLGSLLKAPAMKDEIRRSGGRKMRE